MVKKPAKFEETIFFLAQKLTGLQYAFRGTSSLVLQGLDMNVQDIDLIGDQEMAEASNDLLQEYLQDEVSFKQSDKYLSYFGKFEINGILVEVYGEWQIKDLKGIWSDPFDASDDEINEIEFQGKKIRVTKPETELKMFAKIGRWTAFHKIKRQIAPAKAENSQPRLF